MASGPEKVAELYIETKLEAQSLESEAARGERALGKVTAAAQDAAKALDETDKAINRASSGQGSFAAETEKAAKSLEKAATSADAARKALPQMSEAAKQMAQRAAEARESWKPLEERVQDVVDALARVAGGGEVVRKALADVAAEGVKFGAITREMNNLQIAGLVEDMAKETGALERAVEANQKLIESEEKRVAAYQRVSLPLEVSIEKLQEELDLKQAVATGNRALADTIIEQRAARERELEIAQKTAKLNKDEAEQITNLVTEKHRLRAEIEKTNTEVKKMHVDFGAVVQMLGGPAVLSVGALATAFVGMTVRGMAAAREFRETAATITTTSANLAGQLTGVTAAIEDVARTSGIPLKEIAAAGLEVAQRGVQSLEDFQTKLQLAADLARVTGTSFRTVADGLQQVQSVFGLSATSMGEVAEQLYAVARAGTPLNELFQAIQAAAPTLVEFGISADTAVKALAALVGSGQNPRQAAQMLAEMARQGEEGRSRIAALAEIAPVAGREVDGLAGSVSKLNKALGVDSREARSEWDIFWKRMSDGANTVGDKFAWLANRVADFIRWGDRLEERQKAWFGGLFGGKTPVATTAPIVASTPVGQPRQLADLVVTGNSTTTNRTVAATDDVTRSLERLQGVVDNLFTDLFPQSVSALSEWQAALDKEIATLERGTKAQQERAAVLRQTGEVYAKTIDLLNDFKPNVVGGGLTGGNLEIRQIDTAKQLLDLERQRGQQEAENAALVERTDAERLDHLIEQGRQIDAAIQGALDLADAFGLADDRVIDILSSLSRVATGIAPLSQALKAGGAGDIIGAALPVVGGIAQIASQLGGLFGDSGPSPAQQAAIAALKHNATVLERIAARLDRITLTGTTLSNAERAVQNYVASGLPTPGHRRDPDQIVKDLERFGLTMNDLRQLAKDTGLEFVELTGRSGKKFLEFLGQLSERLSEATLFGDDAIGRLDKVKAEAEFSVAEESVGTMFRNLIEAAIGGGKGASLLSGWFEGFDFAALDSDDPAVRNAASDAARQIIASIFDVISLPDFDFAALGDFTPGQFLAFLRGLLGDIPGVLDDLGEEIEESVLTWSDRMRSIGLQGEVFDWSNLETAQAVFGQLAQLGPDIAAIIAGFDLSSMDGMQEAIEWFQDQFKLFGKTSIHGEEFASMLEGLGLTMEDVVGIINLLQGAFGDAADEAERLAEEERRRIEQQMRDAERLAEQRKRDEERARQEAQRAAEERRRLAEQRRREELAVGSDTIRALQETFRVQGITDEVEQLAQTFQLLTKQAPAFRNLLGGLDVRGAGGRAEALARLIEFQRANPFGLESGNLSQGEVRQQVVTLAEIIRQLNEVEVTGQTESFGIDRSITEIRGERLEGLLDVGNIYLEAIAGHTAAIAAAMTGGGVGAGGTTIFNLEVNGSAVDAIAYPQTTALLPNLAEALAADTHYRDMGA